MTKKNAIRTGGIAMVVAVLLVVWVAFVSTGDPQSDLATEAAELATTTTSTTVAPTTTLARSIGGGTAVDEATTSSTIARNRTGVSLDGPYEPTAGEPEFPLNNSVDAAKVAAEKAAAEAAAVEAAAAEVAAAAPTGPAPVRIGQPSCAAGLGARQNQTAPFTGLSASIPAGLPAVVVKVSNNSNSSRRALIGLDQADIVFEERIEASATRFFSVFHSSLPANVGPVRSGRTTDIQIAQNLNRPVFGYSGSNQGVARQIKFAADNGILTPFINTDRAPFARDGRYRAPDNLFVDPASLGACGGKGNPTAVFSYGSASSTTARAASSVSLQARSPYRFDWNGAKWVRSQSGTAHVTRTGAALAPTNVVVLFVPYVPSQIDAASVDAQTIGSGKAWVFRDGTVTDGNWRRNKGHEAYTLTDGNGSNVRLAPGQTWVVLAPTGSASYK